MASSGQQTMENVERQRLQLEENVAKLREALDTWSTWEIEYEMLKEELQRAGSPSPAEMLAIGRELGGKMVSEKEVAEFLGKDPRIQRSANKVVELISKRIDYVQNNRQTVEKQHEKAEKLLAGMSLLSDPGLENEEGLPIMDIEEELDEHENVVSGSVMQPGKAGSQLIEVLKNAGLHKADENTPIDDKKVLNEISSALNSSASAPAPASNSTAKITPKATPASTPAPNPTQMPTATLPVVEPKAPSTKKSVKFAEDIQVQTFDKPKGLKDDLKNWNLKPGQKVFELGEEGEVISKVIVPNESPEDAALRREMLQYGLSEVSNVVAELEVDEDEDLGEFDDDEDSDENEEEDEHGRSTRPFLTDEYRQQMMELEKKLNARMVENVGPQPDQHALADAADNVRTLRVRKDEQFDELMHGTDESSADAAKPAEEPAKAAAPKETISETIVERSGPTPQAPAPPSQSKPAKVSRFKSARASNSRPPPPLPTPSVPEPPSRPTGPAGRVLAPTVAEHTAKPSDAQAPNEFDPVLLNREISQEYHRMRNKMISQQGGFKADSDEDEDPIVEEKDGKVKKVSRFRAARLKADGL
ncbi:hypothetical protein K458DRAFT_422047 [Lentithecium fluviatile CBS 122367]|uniref:DUF3835 domain-containing protein n=1 Tax=Lentithecium fluviatile CBS 122367 TaxID=1168545 RepID=A0A6G1INC1_9PLEO|nr:hypothetical protein K458DRAFT_422047 [Lentithecium fluviatile CBS 122367]